MQVIISLITLLGLLLYVYYTRKIAKLSENQYELSQKQFKITQDQFNYLTYPNLFANIEKNLIKIPHSNGQFIDFRCNFCIFTERDHNLEALVSIVFSNSNGVTEELDSSPYYCGKEIWNVGAIGKGHGNFNIRSIVEKFSNTPDIFM